MGKFYPFLFLLSFLSISFSINKVYVFDLKFEGNSNIKSIELEDLLRLQKRTFFSTTEFKINKLNLDLITLQSFYRSKGYLDVHIDYSYDYIDDNNVSIVFIVSEGIRYRIKQITISGNKSFNDSYILNLIKFDSKYYNPGHLRNKLLNLKTKYLQIGKINILINEQLNKDNSSINLQIDISEGNKFYINDISISGLEKINRRLVDRELLFSVGDLYNINLINKSKTNLFESQLFGSVEIFPYIQTDTTIILDIRLRELRSKEIEFEFGFSQLPSNQGDLPVSAINLSGNINRGNLFNTAMRLSFRAEHGFSYSNDSEYLRSYYELGLHAPWFLNIRIPFRFKIYNDNIFLDNFGFKDRKLGIITYIENYRSSNPYLSAGLITDFFQSSNRRSIYASYVKHNIKNFIQPMNGYYVSINPRLNGTFLGGAFNYFKSDFEFKIFKNLFSDIVYAMRIKSGFIYKINYSDKISEVPDFDKFFLGGPSSLRGWLSPLDYNDEEGDLARFLLNCELRIPIYKIIGMEIFYDGGTTGNSDIKKHFNWNVGWGITILSSLGPARIDFAFKEGSGRSVIQVSLLNMF